jgi:alpha-L-arabinofuranosidase
MNLFTIFRSPLFFGGDLPSNDAFTLSLLTNKEVLKMHSEGTDVKQLFQKDGKVAITSKNEKTGDVYLALFNMSDKPSVEVSVALDALGVKSGAKVTEMWSGKQLDATSGATFVKALPAHASGLYKISK